jgi:hypothetical protein
VVLIPANLPLRMKQAGFNVIELPGWQNRSNETGTFLPLGLMLHHDGMGLGFNNDPDDDLNVPHNMAKSGSYGSQLWVKKDSTWVFIAAGRMPHAGPGTGAFGIPKDAGNKYTIGIETDHKPGNPWPQVQLDSILNGSTFIASALGLRSNNCLGHKEYAPGRKTDPENFNLNAWRLYIGGGILSSRKDEIMATAKEAADAILNTKVDVKDAYYGWLGRNPERKDMTIKQLIIEMFQDSKIQTRDSLIMRGKKPEDVQ